MLVGGFRNMCMMNVLAGMSGGGFCRYDGRLSEGGLFEIFYGYANGRLWQVYLSGASVNMLFRVSHKYTCGRLSQVCFWEASTGMLVRGICK